MSSSFACSLFLSLLPESANLDLYEMGLPVAMMLFSQSSPSVFALILYILETLFSSSLHLVLGLA